MVPPRVELALVAIKTRLIAEFGERFRELRLFGSYARGEAREDSDVDVLVLLDRIDDRRDKARAIDIAAEVGIDAALGVVPIVMGAPDLARLRSLETTLAYDLDHEGIVM
jgi:hypothetical protein